MAVAAFLDRQLSFLDIPAVIEDTLARVPNHAGSSLEAVLAADAAARTAATSAVRARPL